LLANTTDDDVPKVFSTSYGEDEDTWSNGASSPSWHHESTFVGTIDDYSLFSTNSALQIPRIA